MACMMPAYKCRDTVLVCTISITTDGRIYLSAVDTCNRFRCQDSRLINTTQCSAIPDEVENGLPSPKRRDSIPLLLRATVVAHSAIWMEMGGSTSWSVQLAGTPRFG